MKINESHYIKVFGFVVGCILVYCIWVPIGNAVTWVANPPSLGIHYIVDIDNVPERLLTDNDKLVEICETVLNKTSVNVIDSIQHTFSPQGFTALYLLAESHLSIHTWPEAAAVRMDLFSCNNDTSFAESAEYIKQVFNGARVYIKTLRR